MKSWKKRALIGGLALSLLASTTYAGYSWWSYGGDQKRTRVVQDEKTSPPLYNKWQLQTGWSISQPIVVPIGNKKFIFHQAQGRLYKIPLELSFYDTSSLPNIWSEIVSKGGGWIKIANNYEARSHLAYDPNTNTLYVGTGDSKVIAVDPISMREKDRYPIGGRLVTAPHVMSNGVMVIGTADANIKVFKGVGNGTSYALDTSDAASQITGSFAQVDADKILVPLNYYGKDKPGKVGLFRVNTSAATPTISKLWEVTTLNGVATNVVYDERFRCAMFADQSGAVYAVNVDSGQVMWRNTDYRSTSAFTTLVNNSPAHLEGDTLVVPFRYRGGRGKGLVVAFNAGNGSTKWAVTSSGEKYGTGGYAGEIANDPTILKTPSKSYVMFGTTQGILRVANLASGALEPIAYTKDGKPLYSIEAAKIGGGSSAYQGRGLATELLAAEGHLVFGSNSSDKPDATGTNGMLYAYAADLTDLSLQNPSLSPAPPQTAGTAATFTVQAVNDSEQERTTKIGWWYEGENFSYHAPITVTLAPREKKNVPIPIKYSATPRNVYAEINPERNAPVNEINWTNNRTSTNVGVLKPNLVAKDIRINPTRPQVGDKLIIDVLVQNEGGFGAVTSDLAWRVNAKPVQVKPNLLLPMNKGTWISGLEWPAVPGEQTMLDVWAKINPSENKPTGESNYSDNTIKKSFPLASNLDFFVKSVSGATIFQGQQVQTRVVVGRASGGDDKAITTNVRLYIGGQNIEAQRIVETPVTLRPGEETSLIMDWNSNDPDPPLTPGAFTLSAVINPDFTLAEVTLANNYMTAGLTIQGKTSNNMCGPWENSTWAVSGHYTYQYNCRTIMVNDKAQTVCDTGVGQYYEHLDANITGLTATYVQKDADETAVDVALDRLGTTTVKAGQGFTFDVETRYSEDRGRTGSVDRVVATFSTIDGGQEEIDLVREYTGNANFVRWVLPHHFVQMMGDGQVVSEGIFPTDDEYMPGGRAHYLSRHQKDGTYPFSVRVYARGVNSLSACLEGEVQVKGSVYEDFYVRQVDPDNPFPKEHFPDGPTEMWKDHMDIFDQELSDWYNYREGWENWPFE